MRVAVCNAGCYIDYVLKVDETLRILLSSNFNKNKLTFSAGIICFPFFRFFFIFFNILSFIPIVNPASHVTIVSRTDDVINVAAHRIATGAIEECLVEIPEILETAVVGKNHTLKGKVPVAFVVLKTSDKKNTRSILNTAGTKVTDTLGRFSAVHEFYVVKRLPKTRSGKTPRNTLTAICNKDDYIVPSTIDDELVYPEIHELLEDKDNIFRFEAKSS